MFNVYKFYCPKCKLKLIFPYFLLRKYKFKNEIYIDVRELFVRTIEINNFLFFILCRIEVCKPLGKVEILPVPYVTENRRINIVLPVSVNDRSLFKSILQWKIKVHKEKVWRNAVNILEQWDVIQKLLSNLADGTCNSQVYFLLK